MRTLIALSIAVLLAACGGGSGDTGTAATPPVVTNALVGGVWTGTDGIGFSMFGIVSETGEFHFIRGDNVQFIGTVSSTGNSLSGTFEAFTAAGSIFPDGSGHGTGTIGGIIAQRSSMSGSTQFRTDLGSTNSSTVSLSYSSIYNRLSSLQTVSGNYRDPVSGDVISVTTGGVVTWQDPTTHCVGNGTVSLINPTFNAYRVQFNYANCTGNSAILNGIPFSGLGTLDNSVSPERFIAGLNNEAAMTKYAVVYSLQRI